MKEHEVKELRYAVQRIRHIVFDLDGTLVESMPYEQVLAQVGAITGRNFEDLFVRYRETWKSLQEARSFHISLARHNAEIEAIKQVYSAFVSSKTNPSLLNGSRELLEVLKKNLPRVQLICWTRGEEDIQLQTMRRCGLIDLFDKVIVVGRKGSGVNVELDETVQEHAFAVIGDSFEQDILPLQPHASWLAWISGTEANRYLTRPEFIPARVHEFTNIWEVFQAFRRIC